MTPLITPAALSALMERRELVLLDARTSRAAYDELHLDNAIHADLERDLSAAREPGADPAKGGRHPLPSLERWAATLGAWGISAETPVVVYDDQSGANAAARLWWMLRAVGHENVAVLDGGFQAAVAEALPVSSSLPRISAAPPYRVNNWSWSTVDIDDVERLRHDSDSRLLDVRAAFRFRGESEPIDPVAGHIPGAINLPFNENLRDGRFKPAAELRDIYERLLGPVSPAKVAVHCGSGVTACHTLLALEAAGLHGAALYVGSWGEWCRNVERERSVAAGSGGA